MKKALSFCLILALILPCFAAFSFAEEAPTGTTLTEIVDQTDGRLVYTEGGWGLHNHSTSGILGSTVYFHNTPGASASYTFVGSSVEYYATKESNRGVAEVFIDGSSVGKFDQYAPSTEQTALIYKAEGLSEGEHTIKVVVTGEKNDASLGTYIDIDGFISRSVKPYTVMRYDDRDPAVTLSEGWTLASDPNLYGKTETYSSTAGATAEIAFTGVGISVYSATVYNRGIAEFYIDGSLVDTVDLYTPSGANYAVFEKVGLENKAHTLTIKVTDQKNEASNGNYVEFDKFDVYLPYQSFSEVVKNYTIKTPTATDKALTSVIPLGYTATVKASDTPSIVALDGTITSPVIDTYVRLVMTLSDGVNSQDIPYTLYIPKKDLGTASYTVDDADTAKITYSGRWTHDPNNACFGGTFSYSNETDATASFTFTGTAVSLLAKYDLNAGVVEILLDGESQGTVDLYREYSIELQTIFEKDGLSMEEHTVVLKATGEKNALSSGSYIYLDAITYEGEFDNTPTTTVSFTGNSEVVFDGGRWDTGNLGLGHPTRYSDTIGATATFTFYGNEISLYCAKQFNLGIVAVTLDGTEMGEYDLSSDVNTGSEKIFTYSDLENKIHTIVLTVTGKRGANNQGAFIGGSEYVYTSTIITDEIVLDSLTIKDPAKGESKITLPTLPSGYTLSITSSTNDLIAADGSFSPVSVNTPVDVTLTLTGAKTLTKTVTVILPGSEEAGIKAFLSLRNNGDKHDARLVLLVKEEAVADVADVAITITFTKNGSAVRTMTASLTGMGESEKLLAFRKVMAAGIDYTAEPGAFYTGIIVSDIPDGAWDSVSLSVTEYGNASNVLLPAVSASYQG